MKLYDYFELLNGMNITELFNSYEKIIKYINFDKFYPNKLPYGQTPYPKYKKYKRNTVKNN